MTDPTNRKLLRPCMAFGAALYALLMPIAAHTQMLGDEPADETTDGASTPAAVDAAPARDRSGPRVDVVPYVELEQVLTADLNGNRDTVTYTSVAAGVAARVSTRRAEAQADVRYERRIAWQKDVGDQNVLSGLARARVDVVPNRVSVEGDALATRARRDIGGSAPGLYVGDTSNTVDVYSVYAGPNVSLPVGEATLSAAYRIGYNRVENSNNSATVGGLAGDLYYDSTNQVASATIGVQPGVLPVGLSVGVGYEREDVSLLDQRYERKFVRIDATLPVSPTLQVVGGLGYEDAQASQREVLRDGLGNPVIDNNGRFVTDASSPRRLNFDTDGLIYDVGVLWRPSRRTALEAHAGRRYGGFFFAGSYQQQIDSRTNLAFGAYQTFSSYGRRLTNALAGLPTQFDTYRNPLDGSIGSCVYGADNQGGGGCFDAALAGTTSANFVARGLSGQLSTRRGGWDYGFSVGVDQRLFKGRNLLGTIDLEGATDESYFASLSAGTQLDARSGFDMAAYLRYFDSELGNRAGVLGYGATAAYNRRFTRGLSGVAALGIYGSDQDNGINDLVASALLGARYSF